MKRYGLLLIAALLIPAGAAAKDIAVPGDAATLEEAAGALAEGDRIVLAPGEYTESVVFPEGIGFSLVGREGAEETVIRSPAEGVNPLVIYGGGKARIEGITFDMRETQGTFALMAGGRDLELRNCVVSGGSGAKIDTCEGVVAGNRFENCLDGLRILNSPIRIDGNVFAGSLQYDIICRGSSAEIVRNSFLNTGNAVILIVGKRYYPVVGGAPGMGNVFKGAKYLVIANESRNEINARYNYWGPVLTSTMDRLGYPANLDEIQDYWDSDDRAAGKVDYSDWLRSEDDRGGSPALQIVLLAAGLAVLILLLLLLLRRRGGAAPA